MFTTGGISKALSRLLNASARVSIPLSSIKIPAGLFRLANVDKSPSPKNPWPPFPATVITIPVFRSIFLIT